MREATLSITIYLSSMFCRRLICCLQDDMYSSEVYTESEGDEYHEGSTDNEIHDKQGDGLDDDGYDDDEDEDADDDEEEDEDAEHDGEGDHQPHEVQVDDCMPHLYKRTKSESNSEAESNLSHDKVIIL